MIINVRYTGYRPDLDAEIEKLVGQESVSAGFHVPSGKRDLQFDVEQELVRETIQRLQRHGLTAEVRKPSVVR